MKGITIRPQQIGDAKALFAILTQAGFDKFFPVTVKSISQEREFLRNSKKSRKDGTAFHFSILYRKQVIGAVGFSLSNRSYVAEIGYFVAKKYWGNGVATKALKLAEEFAFNQCAIHRLELFTAKENIASKKVAIKCGFKKEGIARGKFLLNDTYSDAIQFAKLLSP